MKEEDLGNSLSNFPFTKVFQISDRYLFPSRHLALSSGIAAGMAVKLPGTAWEVLEDEYWNSGASVSVVTKGTGTQGHTCTG